MTEPLVVDPSRLEVAGDSLRSLVFPVPPSPISVTGTDAVSASINETLPAIESPVTDGLPAAKAALTRTGSSMTAAADMYADTDQRLGDQLDQVQFFATGENPANGAKADRSAGVMAIKPTNNPADDKASDKPADEKTPITPQPGPQPTPSVPQFGQTVGQAAPFAQSFMQSAQGAAGNMPGSSSPAQLASQSTKTEQAPADQAQLVDDKEKADTEEEQRPEALAEGAAPGDQTLQGAPVQPTTAGRPGATPSGITL